ncbi:hypothetical protein B0H10DRAFT_2059213 [Mycena sp. CBHHK59/15]|nr:hypothetical protein B0H10DRAFT_2059213 [Mycena sp. CBHHK59/15]
MVSVSQELAELIQLIADARTTNGMALAGFMIIVADHIATLKDEVQLIWKSRLCLSNFLYIWIRYFTLLAISIDLSFMLREVKSDHTCRTFLLTQMATSTLIVVTVDVILVLRVWILYGKSRALLYFLIPLIAAEIMVMFVVGTLSILPLGEYLHLGHLIMGCYSLNVPRYLQFYAVPPFFTSFLMFSMTLYTCGRTLLDSHKAVKLPVITLFLRDGVFWFLIILVISVGELVIWARGRPSLAEVMIIPATAMCATVGARVLLNIKNLASSTTVNSETIVTNASMELDTVQLGTGAGYISGNRSRQLWFLSTTDTGGI